MAPDWHAVGWDTIIALLIFAALNSGSAGFRRSALFERCGRNDDCLGWAAMAYPAGTRQGRRMFALIRAATLSTLLALAACNAPPQKQQQAAASSAPASSAPAAAAQPAHHWAFQNGDQYGYLSGSHGE